MGLLSRFGRGLTQAAPIMGQMAQASLLQAADEKKYNRLLEREELKYTRGLEAAELAYTRGVSAAGRKERLTFIDTGLTLNDNRIKMETDLIGRLTVNENTAMNPMNKELIRGEIEDARKRLADALATKNRLTALYQSYVDPEGKLGVFSKAEEDKILTDVAIMNAASIGKDEILGADIDALNVAGAEGISTEEFDIDTDIFTDVQRAARRENKDVLIEEQLKALDEAVAGRADPLNDKQKKLFRDTMESYVQDRKHLSDPDISARRVAAEERTDKEIASVLDRKTGDAKVVEIIEPREGLRAPSPQDIHRIAQSYGAVPPNFFAGLGEWLGDVGSWTLEQFQKIPIATIMDWLSKGDRAMFESMGIDPDATPVGFGESAMNAGDKPSAEDAIAMMFDMPQRV